jgi:pimeloyl-ACP methyl ester carboxylesterase
MARPRLLIEDRRSAVSQTPSGTPLPTEEGIEMARIVLVHGAFNELWGPNELKARWLPALRDGLWHHDVEISDDDVAVCFYGDLFRRMPGSDAERRLEATRAGVAESLTNLAGEEAIAGLGQAANDAAFDRTVDMVNVMMTQPDLRDRMRDRLEAVLDSDTSVLVAHSLGSVLAYIALTNHPEWAIDTFVTIGSPLASPMMASLIDGAAEGGRGVWPSGVRRWVNVRAVGDRAAEFELRDVFGSRVEEFLIDNGHRAHAPEPYLNSTVTGGAIAPVLAR